MKKTTLTLALLLTSLIAQAKVTETVLEISKTIHSKNVLHYQVDVDESSCLFTSGLVANWKMDEEDGRWKSLNDSMGMIKAPLTPKIVSRHKDEIVFETPSMHDLVKKGLIDEAQVSVRISKGRGAKCEIQTLGMIHGQMINVERLHSKVTFFGNVKWVEVIGTTLDGRKFDKKFKN